MKKILQKCKLFAPALYKRYFLVYNCFCRTPVRHPFGRFCRKFSSANVRQGHLPHFNTFYHYKQGTGASQAFSRLFSNL